MSLFPVFAPVAAALLPTTDLDHRWQGSLGVTESSALVSQWDDQVGSRDFSEGTNKPTLISAGLNGYDTIRFDGSNDRLTDASGSVTRPFHAFFVVNAISWASGDQLIFGAVDASPYNVEVYQTGSSPNINIDSGVSLGEIGLTVGTFRMLHFFVPGSGTTGFIGINDDTVNSASGSASRSFNGGITLCRKPSGSGAGNYEIADIAFYGAEQTSTALADIKTYFNDRYDLGF